MSVTCGSGDAIGAVVQTPPYTPVMLYPTAEPMLDLSLAVGCVTY